MFKWFSKTPTASEEYNAGYDYAAGSLMSGRLATYQIEAGHLGVDNNWSRGAMDAVLVYKELNRDSKIVSKFREVLK
jgi:hypothetical protein